MELPYFIFILLIGILFSSNKYLIKKERYFFLIWFSIYFSLSLIVRENLLGDIATYAKLMDNPKFIIHASEIYYLKEPVVWLGQRFLFYIFQNARLVFISTDIFVGLVLYSALKNLRVPQYIYFSILIFFPFVIGMQMIYRQWVSSIFFLYAFSFVWDSKNLKAFFVYFLSILSHNMSSIFFAILFIQRKRSFGNIIWIFSLLISILGVYIGSNINIPVESGADLSLGYIFLIFSFILFLIIIDRNIIKKIRIKEYKLIISLLTISFFAFIFNGSVATERISMFSLLLIYPLFSKIIEERIKQKIYPRIFYMIMGIIPIIISPSTKIFIN